MNGKSKKQKLILRIIIGVSIAAMVGALVMIFRSLSEYKIGSDSYRELERFVTPPQTDSTSFGQDEKASRWPVVDFESLWEINPDVVAWQCLAVIITRFLTKDKSGWHLSLKVSVYLYFQGFFCRFTKMITLDILALYSDEELKQLANDFVTTEKARLFM